MRVDCTSDPQLQSGARSGLVACVRCGAVGDAGNKRVLDFEQKQSGDGIRAVAGASAGGVIARV